MEIRFFKPEGPHGFLSNYYRWWFVLDCRRWETVEHYYQAAKFHHRPELGERIRLLPDGDAAKSFAGQREPLWSPDWGEIRLGIMQGALRAKFGRSALRTAALLATGDAWLAEASPYDDYWGLGLEGNGNNHLGRLLMELRAELRA